MLRAFILETRWSADALKFLGDGLAKSALLGAAAALLARVQPAAGLAPFALALLAAHGCLLGIRSVVASMGIVLNAAKIYPVEWAILLLVFVISILPTSIMTLRMSRQDSIDR